jgi:hypothetical protein
VPPQNRSTKASATEDVGPAAIQAEIESQAEQTDGQQTEAVRVEAEPNRPATLRLPLPFGRQMLVEPGAIPGWLLAEPAGRRLLWLGGLGAMATIGLLEWPVAVAVGAGSYVAERLAREESAQRTVHAPAPPRV